MKKNSEFDQLFARKTEETLTILLNTSYISYLIHPLPPLIIIMPWCSGYGVKMQVIRSVVQTPVNNTTEKGGDHLYTFTGPILFCRYRPSFMKDLDEMLYGSFY